MASEAVNYRSFLKGIYNKIKGQNPSLGSAVTLDTFREAISYYCTGDESYYKNHGSELISVKTAIKIYNKVCSLFFMAQYTGQNTTSQAALSKTTAENLLKKLQNSGLKSVTITSGNKLPSTAGKIYSLLALDNLSKSKKLLYVVCGGGGGGAGCAAAASDDGSPTVTATSAAGSKGGRTLIMLNNADAVEVLGGDGGKSSTISKKGADGVAPGGDGADGQYKKDSLTIYNGYTLAYTVGNGGDGGGGCAVSDGSGKGGNKSALAVGVNAESKLYDDYDEGENYAEAGGGGRGGGRNYEVGKGHTNGSANTKWDGGSGIASSVVPEDNEYDKSTAYYKGGKAGGSGVDGADPGKGGLGGSGSSRHDKYDGGTTAYGGTGGGQGYISGKFVTDIDGVQKDAKFLFIGSTKTYTSSPSSSGTASYYSY